MNNRKTITLLLLATTLALTAGCSTMRGFPDPPSTSTAEFPQPGYQLGPDAIKKYNEESNLQQKKILRNEIIDARMFEIDSKFGDFERAIYKEGVGLGVGTDWLLL